jgi:NADH dehydrogenase/NADH:ubiquinone oxidoreductase subunit G
MVVNSFVNHLKQVGEFDGQEKFAKILQQFEGVGDHKYEQINKAWKSWIAGEFEVDGIDRKQLKKELKARGIDYSQIDNWTASGAQKRGLTKIKELITLDEWNNSKANKSVDEIRKLFEKKYPGTNFYQRVDILAAVLLQNQLQELIKVLDLNG